MESQIRWVIGLLQQSHFYCVLPVVNDQVINSTVQAICGQKSLNVGTVASGETAQFLLYHMGSFLGISASH